jgi:hypothetical protein
MATTPKGLSDEKAARMMTVLRNGRTLGTFGVKAPRLEAYFKTHPDFAREARPLIKANNATIGIRRLAAAAVGRQRSADRRRNSETCANGHVRTLENTFYVQNERQCLVRRCKDCNIVARAARMPKAEKVRMVISGLHHGQVISDFRSYITSFGVTPRSVTACGSSLGRMPT